MPTITMNFFQKNNFPLLLVLGTVGGGESSRNSLVLQTGAKEDLV